jgi:hypothetical protein
MENTTGRLIVVGRGGRMMRCAIELQFLRARRCRRG